MRAATAMQFLLKCPRIAPAHNNHFPPTQGNFERQPIRGAVRYRTDFVHDDPSAKQSMDACYSKTRRTRPR